MRLCISIASILLVTTPAVAAVITIREQTPDRPSVVVVEGSLAAFDEDQFAIKAASLSSAFIAFSSDGGSLLAGLRIGEAIRRKGFSTIVPDGRRCASACALAWLGGVERFIGTGGKIGFHAAYDPTADESGVGTAVVDAYLSKIGLPHEAIIYIIKAASNEMTWLNISDAAQRGIRVTLLSSQAKETMAVITTRYGDVTVTRDDAVCCVGHIRFRDRLVELASTGQFYASLEGVYKIKEGDLVVMSSPSGARGSAPRYYVLLVGQDGMTDLTGSNFGSSDGTFKATQRDDEVHFDLGFQKRQKKRAIYKNGTVTVDIRSSGPQATLPRMRGGPQYGCDMCSTAGVQRGENVRQVRNRQPALFQQSRTDASIHVPKVLQCLYRYLHDQVIRRKAGSQHTLWILRVCPKTSGGITKFSEHEAD